MGIFDFFSSNKNNNSEEQYRLYKKDISGLKSYFNDREGMEGIFNRLTTSIRKGITVNEFLKREKIIDNEEIKKTVLSGFNDISLFLNGFLESEENVEIRIDYDACQEAINILSANNKDYSVETTANSDQNKILNKHFENSLKYSDSQEFNKAVEELTSAIRIEKNNSILYYNRSLCSFNSQDIYFDLGDSSPKEKNFIEAIKDLEYALKINKGKVTVSGEVISFNKSAGHFQLAVVKTHSGDLSGAKDELKKARELDYDENAIDHMYAVIDEIIEIGYDEHIDRNKL